MATNTQSTPITDPEAVLTEARDARAALEAEYVDLAEQISVAAQAGDDLEVGRLHTRREMVPHLLAAAEKHEVRAELALHEARRADRAGRGTDDDGPRAA